MAVTINTHKDGEARGIAEVLKYLDLGKTLAFPNVMFFPWESDVLAVSSAGYVTEYEVKSSISDWKADVEKDKFKHPMKSKFERAVKQLYYVVPVGLYEKYQQSAFPIAPGAGICVYGGWAKAGLKIEQQAKTNVNAKPLDQKDLMRLYRSVYYRYLRLAQTGRVRVDLQTVDWSAT
jgi:hypothetical protein